MEKTYYELVINGNVQTVLGKTDNKEMLFEVIKSFKNDGRLKQGDKVEIRCTYIHDFDWSFLV